MPDYDNVNVILLTKAKTSALSNLAGLNYKLKFMWY